MSELLANYIAQYGYWAIFGFVFLQEIGIPTLVLNEIVLLFSGYLASTNVLSFPLVFLTVVLADFIGTSLLYGVFYFFGEFILRHKPRWIPVSHEMIEKIGEKISERNKLGIYLGRLIPYVRGYVSVAAGLLEVKPRPFLTIVFLSAVTWSGGYVILGKILGDYWQDFAEKIGDFQSTIIYVVIVVVAVIFAVRYFIKRAKKIKNNPL